MLKFYNEIADFVFFWFVPLITCFVFVSLHSMWKGDHLSYMSRNLNHAERLFHEATSYLKLGFARFNNFSKMHDQSLIEPS